MNSLSAKGVSGGLAVAIAVVGLVAAVFVREGATQPPASKPSKISVPSLVGLPAKTAKQRLAQLGLKSDLELGTPAPSAERAYEVFGQSPAADASVASGDVVRLTIFATMSPTPAVVPTAKLSELSRVATTPMSQMSEETIDPDTGRLRVVVVDLSLPAGPLVLDVRRALVDRPGGLLGRCWRLNWEQRLVRLGSIAELELLEGTVVFVEQGDDQPNRLISPLGDVLVFEADRAECTFADGTRDVFDKQGRWVERIDPNDNRVTLRYDARGRLASIAGPFQSSLKFTADETGRIVRIDGSDGRRVRYVYGQQPLAADPGGSSPVVEYAYHDSGLLAQIVDPTRGAVAFSFDARGRVTQRRWADNASERYEYDDAARTVRHLDAAGRTTTRTRSADGKLAEIVDGAGQKYALEFASTGAPTSITGPTKQTVRIQYDSLARLSQIDSPGTGLTRFEYAGNSSRLEAIQQPGDRGQSFQYDAHGNLRSTTSSEAPCETSKLEYFPNGLLKTWQDCQGRKYVFAYDDRGHVSTITDEAGQVTSLESDAMGNLVRYTSPTGDVTSRTYDALGRLASETAPHGGTTTYEYSSANQVSKVTAPDGTTTTYEYDERGRVAVMTDAAGRVTRYEHHPDGRLKSIVDPPGNTSQFEYDQRGNLLRHINPLGGITTGTYDQLGRLTRLVDPVGQTIGVDYTLDGKVARKIEADGTTVDVGYDALGRTDQFRRQGQTVRLAYTPHGRLAALKLDERPAIGVQYDDHDRISSVAEGKQRLVDYTYDDRGRKSSAKYATGREVTYRYDARGNLAGWADNLGAGVSREFDAGGRVISLQDATGSFRYRYDLAGKLISETDPLANVRRRQYTDAGELKSVREPAGDTASYSYDGAGRLAQVQRPGGGQCNYDYDALGNPTQKTDPLGRKWRMTYDTAGRLLTSTDAKGQVTRYAYDRAGRLLEKRLADGTVVSYSYDAAGYLASIDDGVFPVQYTHDAQGRLTSVEYLTIKRTLRYEYDNANRLAKFTDSEGRTTRYEYDEVGRMTALVLGEKERIALTYDARDRVTSVTYPNGVRGQSEYDAANRPVKLAYVDAKGKTVAGWTYTYDAAGNCIRVVNANGTTTDHRYDPSGQLLEEGGAASARKYTYLPGGSRGSLDRDGQVTKYTYDAADQLGSAGAATFKHDANGNLIERHGPRGTTRYEYNAEDQLVLVVLPDGSDVRYGYAPTGERISRRDAAGLVYYVNSGLDLVAELGEDLQPRATYVQGPGLDQPLAMNRGAAQYFYHADRLGSVAALTDDRAQVVSARAYDAFGNLTSPVRAPSGPENPFAFTGREWDAAAGLYYYRARYYDPDLGRFLSADPAPARMRDPLTLNPYLYARNNPVGYVDPMGLESIWSRPYYGIPPDHKTLPELVQNPWAHIPETPEILRQKLDIVMDALEHEIMPDLTQDLPGGRAYGWTGGGPTASSRYWESWAGYDRFKGAGTAERINDRYANRFSELYSERVRLENALKNGGNSAPRTPTGKSPRPPVPAPAGIGTLPPIDPQPGVETVPAFDPQRGIETVATPRAPSRWQQFVNWSGWGKSPTTGGLATAGGGVLSLGALYLEYRTCIDAGGTPAACAQQVGLPVAAIGGGMYLAGLAAGKTAIGKAIGAWIGAALAPAAPALALGGGLLAIGISGNRWVYVHENAANNLADATRQGNLAKLPDIANRLGQKIDELNSRLAVIDKEVAEDRSSGTKASMLVTRISQIVEQLKGITNRVKKGADLCREAEALRRQLDDLAQKGEQLVPKRSDPDPNASPPAKGNAPPSTDPQVRAKALDALLTQARDLNKQLNDTLSQIDDARAARDAMKGQIEGANQIQSELGALSTKLWQRANDRDDKLREHYNQVTSQNETILRFRTYFPADSAAADEAFKALNTRAGDLVRRNTNSGDLGRSIPQALREDERQVDALIKQAAEQIKQAANYQLCKIDPADEVVYRFEDIRKLFPNDSTATSSPSSSSSSGSQSAGSNAPTTDPEMVEVPNVVGLDAAAAYALINGRGLVAESTFLTGVIADGKDGTVKSQAPAGGTRTRRGNGVQIEIYGAVVPSVIGMSLPTAVDVLIAAGLNPYGVEFQPAPSPALAGRVFGQTPKPGLPIPTNRNVWLKVYDSYRDPKQQPQSNQPSSVANTSKPPSSKSPSTVTNPPKPPNNPPPGKRGDEGFQKGDAARVAAEFATGEVIALAGRGIGSFVTKGSNSSRLTMIDLAVPQNVEGTPDQLREAWSAEVAGLNQDANVKETVIENTLGKSEGVLKYTARDLVGRAEFNNSRYGHYVVYRGFLINYERTENAVNAGIGSDWPKILANAKKVIAERFPSAK